MYAALIIVHAVAGLVALVVRCLVLRLRSLFPLYFWALSTMAVALAGAVALDWGDLDAATRGAFSALLVLAAFLVWRGLRARVLRPGQGARPRGDYLGHVGFTLVALLDGFLVVAVLDLGAPGWLVAAVGVLVAVAGHLAIGAVQGRVMAAEPPA